MFIASSHIIVKVATTRVCSPVLLMFLMKRASEVLQTCVTLLCFINNKPVYVVQTYSKALKENMGCSNYHWTYSINCSNMSQSSVMSCVQFHLQYLLGTGMHAMFI